MKNMLIVAVILVIALVSLSQAVTDTIRVVVREGEIPREFIERVGVSREILISANKGKIFRPGVVLKVPVLPGVNVSQAMAISDDAKVPEMPDYVGSEAPEDARFIRIQWDRFELILAALNAKQETLVVVVTDTVVQVDTIKVSPPLITDFSGVSLPTIFLSVFMGASILGVSIFVTGRKKKPQPSSAMPFTSGIPDMPVEIPIPEETFTTTEGMLKGSKPWKIESKNQIYILSMKDNSGDWIGFEIVSGTGQKNMDGKIIPSTVTLLCPREGCYVRVMPKNALRHYHSRCKFNSKDPE